METKTSRKISVSWNYFENASFIVWIKIFTSSLFLNAFSETCFMSLPCKAIKYTVEADMLRRSPRVHFKDANGNSDTSTGSLSLPSSRSKCETLKLYVLVRLLTCQQWCNCIHRPVACFIETCENRVPPGTCQGQTGPGGLFPQLIHPRTEAQIQTSAAKPGLLPNF